MLEFGGMPTSKDGRNSALGPVGGSLKSSLLVAVGTTIADRPPHDYAPVYASLGPSVAPRDSGPSKSVVLSCKNFPFSASSWFIPAHEHPDFTHDRVGV